MAAKDNLFSGSLELLAADIDTHIAAVDRGFRDVKQLEDEYKLGQRVKLLKTEVEAALVKVEKIPDQCKELNEVLEELMEMGCLLEKPWTAKC